jgi:tRNA threonylcarbamoyladenosine biosynthesis protein TsaE
MTTPPFERTLGRLEDTLAIASALGGCLAAGDGIGLSGDLGAGKTHFVKGLAAGLGVPDATPVTSPTFALLNDYRGGRLVLHHADLYRIEQASELEQIGLDELVGGAGVVAIEWSERFAVLRPDHLRVQLAVLGPTRRALTATAGGPRSAVLLAAWARAAG